MKYQVHSITFTRPDGRKNTVTFDSVRYLVDSIDELKQRLPTEAELHITYTEITE